MTPSVAQCEMVRQRRTKRPCVSKGDGGGGGEVGEGEEREKLVRSLHVAETCVILLSLNAHTVHSKFSRFATKQAGRQAAGGRAVARWVAWAGRQAGRLVD